MGGNNNPLESLVLKPLGQSVAVGTFGTVNPNRKGIVSPGVFGDPGDYARDLGALGTVGAIKSSSQVTSETNRAIASKGAANDDQAAQQAITDRAAADLAARTETPQEATDAQQRAVASSQRLGLLGRRRASQYLAGGL